MSKLTARLGQWWSVTITAEEGFVLNCMSTEMVAHSRATGLLLAGRLQRTSQTAQVLDPSLLLLLHRAVRAPDVSISCMDNTVLRVGGLWWIADHSHFCQHASCMGMHGLTHDSAHAGGRMLSPATKLFCLVIRRIAVTPQPFKNALLRTSASLIISAARLRLGASTAKRSISNTTSLMI